MNRYFKPKVFYQKLLEQRQRLCWFAEHRRMTGPEPTDSSDKLDFFLSVVIRNQILLL